MGWTRAEGTAVPVSCGLNVTHLSFSVADCLPLKAPRESAEPSFPGSTAS